MRWLTCYVKPFQLDAVIEAVLPLRPELLLVEDVRGYGRQKGHLELYRGSEYEITFLPKVRLDIVVPLAREGEACRLIAEAARTGRIGDGKILVRETRRAFPATAKARERSA